MKRFVLNFSLVGMRIKDFSLVGMRMKNFSLLEGE
jgi:hypothetical protein